MLFFRNMRLFYLKITASWKKRGRSIFYGYQFQECFVHLLRRLFYSAPWYNGGCLVRRVCFSLLPLRPGAGSGKNYFTNGTKQTQEIRLNIYVGNLPYSVDRDELRGIFEQYGEVSAARVVSDRETGRSKGFGFVEMPDDAQANAAIEALNGNEIGGRKAVVNEARPREERPPRR